ncbi:hypothetical protein ScPMuIL_010488 [Solemya velum]
MTADTYNMSETIDDYQVLNLLGKGGFACVYRAISSTTGREVAIKMIDKKLMKAADMASRVRKEVEIHSRLNHPSILELYNYFEDDNYVYLVLELCDGELNSHLKNKCGVLTEREACFFMEQIVEGMLYLHSHGILHRDLSLANLLLKDNLQIKIADFGLATQLNATDDKRYTICGTPNYISPEVASKSAHGLEADVWSLGCMLYTFLVGQPPFVTKAVKSTLNRVISAEYNLPSYLSDEAVDLIKSFMKKNPKERIFLSDILRHPFMTKNSMLGNQKTSNQTLCRPIAIDSAREETTHITTNMRNSRPTSSKSTEDEERAKKKTSCNSTFRQSFQPLSPPVRLPRRDNTITAIRSDSNNVRIQFDPSKYQSNNSSSGLHALEQSSNVKTPADPIHKDMDHTAPKSEISMKETPKNETQDKIIQMEKPCSGFSSNIRDTVLPLSTARLRPIRQRTKNAMVTIMESGMVCLEFLKVRQREEHVVDVFVVSANGQEIKMFQPNSSKGVQVSSQPLSLPRTPLKSFSYNDLPQKYWKKYQYAARFVKLVSSKTPKVTIYTQKAKCMLMENSPEADFEAVFYDGAKLTINSKATVVIDQNGTLTNIENQRVTTDTQKLVEYARNRRQQCLNLESAILSVKNEQHFPILIGRRPDCNLNESMKCTPDSHYTTNCSIGNVQQSGSYSHTMSAFDGTVVSIAADSVDKSDSIHGNMALQRSSVTTASSSLSGIDLPTSQSKSRILRLFFVPAVGWTSQHANGEIWVEFDDATKVGVKSTTTTVKYVDQQGNLTRYQKSDILPDFVKFRLEKVPAVLEHLLRNCN